MKNQDVTYLMMLARNAHAEVRMEAAACNQDGGCGLDIPQEWEIDTKCFGSF
jgi:hypothetical protein